MVDHGYLLEEESQIYTTAPKEPESLTEAWERAEKATNTPSEAQRIVDRALAHYCEICDKGFVHTGACRNHKRLKHKTT